MAAISKKNIAGEININVNAELSVDKKTARMCMNLLAIYFKQCGAKGIVLRFNDFEYEENVGVQILTTEEAVDDALMAQFRHSKEE